MTSEDKSKIDELKKSLYSRNAPDVRRKRRFHFARQEPVEVDTEFDTPDEEPNLNRLNEQYENHKMSFFTKLFIGSIIFFVLAVGIGTYLVLNGSNIISANNIEVTINGPVTIAGGDPLSFNVQVANKNNIKLQQVDMAIDFPQGAVDPDNRSKTLDQTRQLLDDINPGGMSQKSVRAVLYGEENSKKEIIINISYRIAGSNAVFQKQKIYEVLISSSPVSLAVNSFKEVTSGQEFQFDVTLTSNSPEIIRNLLLKASYPFGFTFISSDVKTLDESGTVWIVGDLPPGGKKKMTFKGRLVGENGQARVFNFSAGSRSTNNPSNIGTEYITAVQTVDIMKPFITTTIDLGGDTNNGSYVGTFNAPVRATVNYFNNLPTSVIDGEIHVKLTGTALDKASVSPENGYYKSANNEIVFNKITNPELANIGAGENGSISFSFTPRDFSTPLKAVTNPNVIVDVSINGNRISENNVQQNIVSSARRDVKISSRLSLSSNVVRSTGPFANTGAIPPRVDKPTTYTVNWIVDNTINSVAGAEVRALLPAYVTWLGKISPAGEDIRVDTTSGLVVWRVGDLDAHTTGSSHSRQVSFQVSVTPSLAQVGQPVTIVQDTTLVGQDDYTGANLTANAQALTTRFATDPAYRSGDDIVAQ